MNKGATLVELLVCAYILLIGICGSFLLTINLMKSARSSWDTTVAVTHAESLLEEMQNKPGLYDIVNTNWEEWTRSKKLITLPQEKISVKYADPLNDPLDITIAVQWQKDKEAGAIALQTMLTK